MTDSEAAQGRNGLAPRVGEITTRSLLGLGLAFLFGVGVQAADLRVLIDDVPSSSGTIVIGLYDSAAHYKAAVDNEAKILMNDKGRLVGVSLRAVAGRQSVVFTNLKPGTYAVVVFHDENDNGELDKNALGMPREAYGISNDARGIMSAPDFRDAAVVLDQRDKVIEILLFNPLGPSERP